MPRVNVVGLCNVGRTSSSDLYWKSSLTLSVGKMEKVAAVRRLKYAQPTSRWGSIADSWFWRQYDPLIVFDVTPKATGTTSPRKILIFFLFFFFPFSFAFIFSIFLWTVISDGYLITELKYCATILYCCIGSQQQAPKGTGSAWRDLQTDGQFKRLG